MAVELAESQSVETLKNDQHTMREFLEHSGILHIGLCLCVCVTYVYIHYEGTYEVLDIGFVLVCVYLYKATLFRACSSAE